MAIPTTRDDFKAFCLRRLGAPVIEINVSDEQVDDCVDVALKYYYDYHFDGSEKVYYKHQITSEDKENKYITLPENIIGAVSVFPFGGALGSTSDDLFNIQYQIALNDLYSLTSVSMVPYYMTMEHLALVQEMLVGKKPIRYSRHKDRLYIDTNWKNAVEGQYLIVEAYEVIDPEVYPDVWGDRWLQNYCSTLIEETWGRNLTKFTGMTLPGGVQFNGEAILARALQNKEKIEAELSNYTLPAMDFIG